MQQCMRYSYAYTCSNWSLDNFRSCVAELPSNIDSNLWFSIFDMKGKRRRLCESTADGWWLWEGDVITITAAVMHCSPVSTTTPPPPIPRVGSPRGFTPKDTRTWSHSSAQVCGSGTGKLCVMGSTVWKSSRQVTKPTAPILTWRSQGRWPRRPASQQRHEHRCLYSLIPPWLPTT